MFLELKFFIKKSPKNHKKITNREFLAGGSGLQGKVPLGQKERFLCKTGKVPFCQKEPFLFSSGTFPVQLLFFKEPFLLSKGLFYFYKRNT